MVIHIVDTWERSSILTQKKKQLLHWILNNMSKAYKNHLTCTKCGREPHARLLCKANEHKNKAVRQLLHSVGLTHHVGAHIVQNSHVKTEGTSSEFMDKKSPTLIQIML